jgi:hypothetical protein
MGYSYMPIYVSALFDISKKIYTSEGYLALDTYVLYYDRMDKHNQANCVQNHA